MGIPLDPSLWALAISLTVLGGIVTFFAFRRRGRAAGLRALGWTLLPFAALFTHTLTLVLRVVDAVTSWAAGLVFSPVVWIGLALFGCSAGCFWAARRLRARPTKSVSKGRAAAPLPSGHRAAGPADTGLDPEIEAILRDHGIT